MKVEYNIKIKTLSTNSNLKFLINQNFLTKILFFKKYLISKSPFKYNKTKEQFCLKYSIIKFSFKDYMFIPKLVEYIFKNFFFFSNKYLISLKKKEIYIKN